MSGGIRQVFTKPMMPFEEDHAHDLMQLYQYRQEHNGELPDWKWVNRLIERQELNPERFDHWHPNIPKLIERPMPPPLVCKPDDHRPVCHIPPRDCPQPPSVIPEPSSYILMSVGILVAFVLFRMRM